MATQVAVGTELNEVKLIRAGQRGDSQAVETLFRRYQRPLFQTALRVLGNAEDAEDALQDGLPFEPLQIAVCGEQPVLQRVFRVFSISQHAKSGLKQRPLVAPKQGFDGLRVALLPRANQF